VPDPVDDSTDVDSPPDSSAAVAAVTELDVSDHIRPVGDTPPLDPGVYRVVGTDATAVTLLRVGDAAGRRVTTGRVLTLAEGGPHGFARAETPDGNRGWSAAVADAGSAIAWQGRVFVGGLAARPLASLAAVGLFLAGQAGDRIVAGPDAAFTVVALLGVLALVSLGARGG
jgi:hypothetical protein